MSEAAEADSNVSSTVQAVGAGDAGQANASPLDRIPDEVLSLILEQVYLSSLDPRHVAPDPTMPLSNLLINKRVFSLARPIWLAEVYYRRKDEQQENSLINRLTRPDARPLVRRVEYAVALSVRYDLAIISQFTNLVSLKIRVPGLDDDLLLPTGVTSSMHLLRSLQSLFIETDSGPFGLEDSTFNLAQALPGLRNFRIDSTPCNGARRLCASLPGVRALSIPHDPALFASIPWTTIESLQIRPIDPFPVQLDGVAELLQSLRAARLPEPNKPVQPLPLRTVSLPNLELLRFEEGLEHSLHEILELLELLDSIGITHLRTSGESRLQDWFVEGAKLQHLETLTILEGQMAETLEYRSLALLLRQFPSLKRLELYRPDFLGEGTSFDEYPPFPTRRFLLYFPHLFTLLKLVEQYTSVLYLTWHTPTSGVRYEWRRASRKEPFEVETWVGGRPGFSSEAPSLFLTGRRA